MPNVTAELENGTRNIQKRLGNVDDFAQEIFFLGDGIQRTAVDGFFDLLRPSTWSPTGLAQMSSNAVSGSLQVARFFTPGETSYLSWLELRNKLEVFLLVQNLPSILGLSGDKPEPLPTLVDRAYSLSPFAALWAVEGLGHYYADACWESNGPPGGLLSETQAPVPAKSLLMLHAGMGMSFAYRLLSDLITQSPVAQVLETVKHFVRLCRDNSRDGFMGAAIESLGLITRDFYPDMVRRISQTLEETAPELIGFFWHGAGRALYFSRAYFLPILRTPWSAIATQGATEYERLNMMAGLSWGFTLVNMRHPEIVEDVLSTYIQKSDLKKGFANGVSSSIVMRNDTTPDAPFTSAFCGYQPGCAGTEASTLWNTLIVVPCRGAYRSYQELKRNRLLDQVFRFRACAENT
jgi:hypothetical protein